MTDTYQGWTNYETWNANLWFGDNFHDICQQLIEDVRQEQELEDNELLDEDDKDSICSQLSISIEDYIEELIPTLEGMFLDMMTHAVDMIDYREIAESVYESNI